MWRLLIILFITISVASATCLCCYNGTHVSIPNGQCAQYNYAHTSNGGCRHTNPDFVGLPCRTSKDCSPASSGRCTYLAAYEIFTCRTSLTNNLCLTDEDCIESSCIYDTDTGLSHCEGGPGSGASRCIIGSSPVCITRNIFAWDNRDCPMNYYKCVEQGTTNIFCSQCLSTFSGGPCTNTPAMTCSDYAGFCRCNLIAA